MTTEPTAGADAIDRASTSFWQPTELDSQVRGAKPLTAESLAMTNVCRSMCGCILGSRTPASSAR